MSVGEALACSVPVVASSRVGAAHDLVREGVNGFVYPAGDPAALATAIGRGLGLDTARAASTSAGLLATWGPEATWRGMVATAARVAGATP